MSSGVFLTYFTIQHSIWLTTLTYGFMFGLGIALAYSPPMAVAMRWFPKQKGLVNGFIVGGFGMGAFMFNQIQTAYLNPKNLSLDDSGFFTNDEVKKKASQQGLFIMA
jgi:MFS family permease